MRPSILPILTTMALCTTINSLSFRRGNNTAINFIQLEKARISTHNLTLIYSLDLIELKNISIKVDNLIKNAENLCQYVGDKMSCKTTTQHIKIISEFMRDDQNKINEWKSDKIDVKTKLFIEKIEPKINIINKSRINYARDEQIILIKEAIGIKNSVNIETLINKPKHNLNNTRKRPLIMIQTKLQNIINVIELLIAEHTKIAGKIMDFLDQSTIDRVKNIIPKETIDKDMREIEKLLNINYSQDFQHTLKNNAKIMIFRDKIFIEVNLPILNNETYNIYKIIQTPISNQGYTGIINTKLTHILITDSVEKYLLIHENILKNAKISSFNEKIIITTNTTESNFDKYCETGIFRGVSENSLRKNCKFNRIPKTNYIIKIKRNEYYLHINKTQIIYEKCNNTTKQYKIHVNGILKTYENCELKLGDHKIGSDKQFKTMGKMVVTVEKTKETIRKLFGEQITKWKNETNENITLKSTDIIHIENRIRDFDNLIRDTDEKIKRAKEDYNNNERNKKYIAYMKRNIGQINTNYNNRLRNHIHITAGTVTIMLTILLIHMLCAVVKERKMKKYIRRKNWETQRLLTRPRVIQLNDIEVTEL